MFTLAQTDAYYIYKNVRCECQFSKGATLVCQTIAKERKQGQETLMRVGTALRVALGTTMQRV
jgi:hypothetical protein